jgi:hypothetical protein
MNKPQNSFGLLARIALLGAFCLSSSLSAPDQAGRGVVKTPADEGSFSDQLEQYKRELYMKLVAAWKRESAEIQAGDAATVSGAIDEKGKVYDVAIVNGDPSSPAAKRVLEVVKLSYLPPVPASVAEKLVSRRFKFIFEIPLKEEIRVQ